MIFNKELYSTPMLYIVQKAKCMNTEIGYKIAYKSKQFNKNLCWKTKNNSVDVENDLFGNQCFQYK